MTPTNSRAEAFRRLHAQPAPLVLFNAWDAVSARVFEQAGCAAVATTSAGVAWSLGYPDGEALPRRELVAAVERICRVVSVPVSVDIERGFGRSGAEVCETVRALADVGVVGINIEDGADADGRLVDAGVLVERLGAIAELRARAGLGLFVNARTDVYFARGADAATRRAETLRRARAYRDAGADGLFVPGLCDAGELATVATAIGLPLNVYAGIPGMPSLDALAAAGVRRISVGCAPLQALLKDAREMVATTLRARSFDTVTHAMLSAGEINGLFAPAVHAAEGGAR